MKTLFFIALLFLSTAVFAKPDYSSVVVTSVTQTPHAQSPVTTFKVIFNSCAKISDLSKFEIVADTTKAGVQVGIYFDWTNYVECSRVGRDREYEIKTESLPANAKFYLLNPIQPSAGEIKETPRKVCPARACPVGTFKNFETCRCELRNPLFDGRE